MPSGVYKRTEYHKQKLKESIKKRMNNGWVPTIVCWQTGKKFSEEHKSNMSLSMAGKKHKKFSEDTKAKMSKRMMGNQYTLGIFPSEETRKKMSNTHKKRVEMGLNNFWQGGNFVKKYPNDWTETLRRSIRERDNYTCQICGEPQGDKAHAVHHIDYNKNNCNPDNLITLCCGCHAKTNVNRDYWINHFSIIKNT